MMTKTEGSRLMLSDLRSQVKRLEAMLRDWQGEALAKDLGRFDRALNPLRRLTKED